jgi:hypothetical protein
MIDKTAASELLNVNAKTLSKFERLQDPYNLENNLSGYICHQADYRYHPQIQRFMKNNEVY